jgi:hypothetical protein
MYTMDVGANVPLYGQEMCFWCGAASAQMSRDGYPNPADRLFYTQLDLWNSIQLNNSTAPADSGWATDPHGLQGCLQAAANPPGVHWSEFANASRDGLLFSTLYWMNNREFSAPTLVNQGGHWVVIVGWTTDVEPLAGSTPVLQSIHYQDPEPHNVGSDTMMTAAQWYGGPWNGAVMYAGTWLNKYVAIVEPPLERGQARVRPVRRTGSRLLTPAQAVAAARRWIEEHRLAELPKYALLARKGVEELTPLLVREEPPIPPEGPRTRRRAEPRATRAPHYYIVPFGLRGERSETGSPLARVCVLVNAYTGAFEEVTAFRQPLKHLTAEEALGVVAAALRVAPSRLRRADATLMFRPGDITHVRTYPFWRVQVGERFVYVDQLGKLYGKLLPAIPGD